MELAKKLEAVAVEKKKAYLSMVPAEECGNSLADQAEAGDVVAHETDSKRMTGHSLADELVDNINDISQSLDELAGLQSYYIGEEDVQEQVVVDESQDEHDELKPEVSEFDPAVVASVVEFAADWFGKESELDFKATKPSGKGKG